MRPRRIYLGLVALLLGLSLAIGHAQSTDNADAAEDAGTLVYVIPIEGLISDIMMMSIERRASMAEEAGADLIVYEMDTPGGLVTSALDIAGFIKNQRTETLAWVNPSAYSAGALISVAADGIVMAERASMGDAAPIMIGQPLEGTERAKAESPILEEFRDSARRNGYPTILTEAMVRLGPAIYRIRNTHTDEIRYVYSTQLNRYGLESPVGDYQPPQSGRPQPSPREDESPFGRMSTEAWFQAIGPVAQADAPDSDAPSDEQPSEAAETPSAAEGEADAEDAWIFYDSEYAPGGLVNRPNTLLTLTQNEAIEFGFARQIIADDQALMAMAGATEGTFHRLEITWSETLANILVSPGVRGILMILLLLGAYMEIQSPGVGLPGAVAVVALLLMIGGPFIAGLANMVDILLIAAGLILIGVEIFLIPGVGIVGITGVLLVIFGFLMTFVPPDPEPGWLPTLDATWQGVQQGMLVMLIAVIVTGVAGYFISQHMERVPFFRRLVLEGTVDSASVAPADGPRAARDENRPLPPTSPAAAPPASAVHEGARGRAMTGLRPAGRVEIDGQIVDVVTAGRWVEAGEPVRIIEIAGNRIVVEAA